ncbi:hypothetical protein ACLKA6_018820 [Drosophila palustris]
MPRPLHHWTPGYPEDGHPDQSTALLARKRCWAGLFQANIPKVRHASHQNIRSDNGTNFLGAANVLKELRTAYEQQKHRVQEYASERGVGWSFIPPRAPHFRGLWEAAVKNAKHRLAQGVGNARLIMDELSTQIEALLNSGPLASTGNDLNDCEALTPGYLLIGQAILSLPHESELDGNSSKASFGYLKRSRMLLALKQQFWLTWSRDYLTGLQQRTQWAKDVPNLEVSCLLLVHDANAPPQTGRVVATTAGDDNKVRVAEVRTQAGVLKRPIHKLTVLPIVKAP